MVKTKNNISGDIDPPKRRGRVTGAKTYNKQTLFKLIQQYKPVNMVLWGTIAEQYRVACGELEARLAPIIKKFFVQKCAITCASLLVHPAWTISLRNVNL